VPRALHHLDLWVDDVATAEGEWGGEHSPDQHGTHDRLRPGINHLATTVGTRDELDRMRSESTEHGWHSEGFEVEVVAGE
jgi:hypothetical protein